MISLIIKLIILYWFSMEFYLYILHSWLPPPILFHPSQREKFKKLCIFYAKTFWYNYIFTDIYSIILYFCVLFLWHIKLSQIIWNYGFRKIMWPSSTVFISYFCCCKLFLFLLLMLLTPYERTQGQEIGYEVSGYHTKIE